MFVMNIEITICEALPKGNEEAPLRVHLHRLPDMDRRQRIEHTERKDEIMQRVWKTALCALLALLLCSCSLLTPPSEAEQAAQAQCEALMASLNQGDWSAAEAMLPLGGLYGVAPGEDASLLNAMAQGMSCKVRSAKEQEDGSVVLTLRIQNVDLKKLLESLPEGLSSTEEARAAMLERMPDAKRKSFDAQLTLLPAGDGEGWELLCDVSFANALTGGLYDIVQELWGEASAQ